jgi:hypothetical protein
MFSFICEQCQSLLAEQIFYVKNACLFCQRCLHELEPCLLTLNSSISTGHDRCKKCGQVFNHNQSIAVYQCEFYHADCFRCGSCSKLIVSEGFFRQEDGCLYCLTCHITHGPHCTICHEPFLTGELLSQFDGKQFHQTCFLCRACQQPIERKQFIYEHGQFICKLCCN